MIYSERGIIKSCTRDCNLALAECESSLLTVKLHVSVINYILVVIFSADILVGPIVFQISLSAFNVKISNDSGDC